VRWEVVNQWDTGFVANLVLTNRGPALTSWTLTWAFAGNQLISNAWNTQLTQSGMNVTARNASWNGTLATNASTSFGFQASFSGTNTVPSPIRLGGANCTAG
jgi:cellulase/cellobiase CelA1